MRRIGIKRTEVALIHQPALVQYHDAIGVIGQQRLVPAHRAGGADGLKKHGIQICTFGPRQRRHRPVSARDDLGGHQATEIAIGPAVLRKAQHAGIFKAHPLFQGWRGTHHPGHVAWVALDCIQGRRDGMRRACHSHFFQ